MTKAYKILIGLFLAYSAFSFVYISMIMKDNTTLVCSKKPDGRVCEIIYHKTFADESEIVKFEPYDIPRVVHDHGKIILRTVNKSIILFDSADKLDKTSTAEAIKRIQGVVYTNDPDGQSYSLAVNDYGSKYILEITGIALFVFGFYHCIKFILTR